MRRWRTCLYPSPSPGCAEEDLVINYRKKCGSSLYNPGKEAIATEFDMSQKVIFESEMVSKARMMVYSPPTKTDTESTSSRSMVKSPKTTSSLCEVFINGAKAHQRAAQYNSVWAECIKASLSKAARQRVLGYGDNYEVLSTGATHKIAVAPLLYKKVMQLATLDSKATNATLYKNICELTQYAISYDDDVNKIISYLYINFPQLKACREVMANAVQPIFKAFSN